MDDQKGKEIQNLKREDRLPADKKIVLGKSDVLDLSGLSDHQINELKMSYAKGILDVQKKAAELNVEVGALNATLNSFNEQTASATKSGTHATISHSQTTSLGRTEVMIGNTEKAAAGKLSRSAAGEKDRTLMIFGIIAVVVIIIALIFAGGR
jgi:hypothetical protein